MAVCQNLVPLVNINIAGKWMFIPLKMVLIGIDPYPYIYIYISIAYICMVYTCVSISKSGCAAKTHAKTPCKQKLVVNIHNKALDCTKQWATRLVNWLVIGIELVHYGFI